jgi:hypothetical protein
MFSVKEGDRGGLITYFSLLKEKISLMRSLCCCVDHLPELYNFKDYFV